jgi:hypothetical protein
MCDGPVSLGALLGSSCDSLGGTSHVELACRNELAKSGVEFGLRKLSPAWDRGFEANTNGAIEPWQGQSKTRVEYAMEAPEAKDHQALALFDDPHGCDRERGQNCEQDERKQHAALIGSLRRTLERSCPSGCLSL